MKAYKTIVETASQLIAGRKLTIAFAESATAGKLVYAFSLTPYSGEILKGALVCYNACIKEEVLGIPKAMIETFTPESAEVTREMARRVQQLMSTDIAVAVTGLTTTGGSEQPGKPVGTMFYCVCFHNEIHERKKIFVGEPAEIIELAIEQIGKTIIHLFEKGA